MRIYHSNGTVTRTIGRAIPRTYTAAMAVSADMAFELGEALEFI